MARRGGGSGRLRIVAGDFGGRFIEAPRGQVARPTLSKVRESVFSILGPSLDGLTCADLFAGSGAYGLEALSRGAKRVEAYERHRGVGRVTCANAASLLGHGVDARFRLHPGTLPQALETAAWAPYDLLFMDPPWARALAETTCQALAGTYRHLLADDARLVVEEVHSEALAEAVYDAMGFEVLLQRRYGEASITVLSAGPAAR